jgi:hypothetical protein
MLGKTVRQLERMRQRDRGDRGPDFHHGPGNAIQYYIEDVRTYARTVLKMGVSPDGRAASRPGEGAQQQEEAIPDTEAEAPRADPAVSPEVARKAAKLREATISQRARVRELLDKHFDETDGCYCGDWTDQAVAESVNVPRVVVEMIRGAAYGPIRGSEREHQIRRELAEVKRLMERIETEAIEALVRKLGAPGIRIAKIEAELAKLPKQTV